MYTLNETYAGSVCWKMQNADEINQRNLNKWRDTPCPWTGRLNTVKISALFKPIYRFKVVLIKVPARFYGYELCVCSVTQSCLNLCDPMDCSPPGSLSMGFSRQEGSATWVHFKGLPKSKDPMERISKNSNLSWIPNLSWPLSMRPLFGGARKCKPLP